MLIISNAFSLQMLPQWRLSGVDSDTGDFSPVPTGLRVTPVDPSAVLAEHGAFESAVGHADTAALFSTLLGVEVPAHRASVTLDEDTELLVGQYVGPRLPEGATTLPEGAAVRWLLVTVEDATLSPPEDIHSRGRKLAQRAAQIGESLRGYFPGGVIKADPDGYWVACQHARWACDECGDPAAPWPEGYTGEFGPVVPGSEYVPVG